MSGKRVKIGGGGRGMTTRSMANEVKERCLMNHLVLETVFKYCNVKDLKVARQVCHVWRDTAQNKWNKSLKLRISEYLDGSGVEGGNEKYRLFIQMVEHPLGISPQGNWMTFCAQVKTLELAFASLPNFQSLRNALFRCFPNLENLILTYIGVEPFGFVPAGPVTEAQQHRNLKHLKVCMEDHFPLSWMEVLSHFPSLERIDVSAPIDETETIFQAINRIREEDPSKLNFKHISCETFSVEAVRTTLMDRRLQLEALELLFGVNEYHVFRDILHVHADTLKMLAFENGRGVPFPHDFGFPELTKLQELSMTFCVSLEPIELLKFTPNLRKLRLKSYNPGWQVPETDFARFPIMLNACKYLEISDDPAPRRSFLAENWKSLMDWTPNVESLKVFGVDNSTFTTICEGWTNLVELYVEWSQVDGSGITGWDEEDIQRFESMRASKRREWRPITVPRANITSLKNLRVFKMSPMSRIKLNRAVGLHGIEILPDLRRLCIQPYEITPKDRDYWKKLHEKYSYPE